MKATTTLGDFPQIQARSLREQVRHAIYEAMRTNRLKPGDRILELRLAREMGVSQTVVREALRELEQRGLVESFPNRGTYVRRITRDDAREIYSMRVALEAFAIRLAMPRLTDDDFGALEDLIEKMRAAAQANDEQRFVDCDVSFHRTIVAAANHKLLLRTWQSINPFNWTFVTYLRLSGDDPVRLAERHRPLLAALRSGDVALAQQRIEEHIMQLADQLVGMMAEAEDW
jgi:DNA-binding GntR family transcriptional regulator